MARSVITINSVLGGQSPSFYLSAKDQFLSSLAVDPDAPVGSLIKASGTLVPVGYSKFSSTGMSGASRWLMTNPKDTNLYSYNSDGELVSYSSALTAASESVIGTPTSGAGNGAAYFNNYLYLATPTDVSRYGPLTSSPTIANNFWTTTLSLTATTNTTYPSLRGKAIPNHAMHVHTDGALYFCDFVNGNGLIHKIKTSKTTHEGDTNDGSTYNVLDLPFGYYPTDIESYGTDLVLAAHRTTDTTVNQGGAAVFFWDTFSSSFYRQVPLPDPLITALENVNGILFAWTGNAAGGCRMSSYLGGDVFKDVMYLDEGTPPFAGAVDSLGNRIVWGGYVTTPASSTTVFALGSKNARLPQGLHSVAKGTLSGTNYNATAVKFVEQANNSLPRAVFGESDESSAYQLMKYGSGATLGSVWRSQVYNVGGEFTIKKLSLPLGAAVAANMSIVPKVYVDDGSSSVTGTTVNSTNYAASQRLIVQYPEIRGSCNFFLELTWGSTTALPVTLPVNIEIEAEAPFTTA